MCITFYSQRIRFYHNLFNTHTKKSSFASFFVTLRIATNTLLEKLGESYPHMVGERWKLLTSFNFQYFNLSIYFASNCCLSIAIFKQHNICLLITISLRVKAVGSGLATLLSDICVVLMKLYYNQLLPHFLWYWNNLFTRLFLLYFLQSSKFFHYFVNTFSWVVIEVSTARYHY